MNYPYIRTLFIEVISPWFGVGDVFKAAGEKLQAEKIEPVAYLVRRKPIIIRPQTHNNKDIATNLFVLVGEPQAILPIICRPRKSANTTRCRQLLWQSRTPCRWYYVVDQDQDRELPAIFPRPLFLWPTYRAVDSPHNTPHLLIFNAKAFGWSRLVTGLIDSRNHFPPTARAVRALRCTRAWFKHSPHVPRNLCARACQLSLYCSLRHTQHLSCLKDRETVDDA
jgi:hypothetical protein